MLGFLFRIFGPLALLCGVLGGAYWWVSRHFETIGADKAIVACAEANKRGQAETIAIAKADTATAQASSTNTGARTTASTAKTAAVVAAAGKEITDEFAKPMGPSVDAPSFDLGGVSAPLNAVVDRALGAADAADSARRAGQAGTPG